MKYIILALLISSNAYADTAVWTGKFELVSENPYSNTWLCEYDVNGVTYWVEQKEYCKKKIKVKGV